MTPPIASGGQIGGYTGRTRANSPPSRNSQSGNRPGRLDACTVSMVCRGRAANGGQGAWRVRGDIPFKLMTSLMAGSGQLGIGYLNGARVWTGVDVAGRVRWRGGFGVVEDEVLY